MKVVEKKSVFCDSLYRHDEIVWEFQPVPQLRFDLFKEGGELMVECVRGGLVLTVGDVHQQLLLVGYKHVTEIGRV